MFLPNCPFCKSELKHGGDFRYEQIEADIILGEYGGCLDVFYCGHCGAVLSINKIIPNKE